MIGKLFNYKVKVFGHILSGRDLLKHPLFSGSLVMVVGTNFANFFAYIYHVIIGRIFGPEAYGTLAATLSLIGIIASAVTFFSVVIVKFVSAAEPSERKRLFSWFISRGVILGIILWIVSFFLNQTLSNFMHVDPRIIFLIGPILLVTLVSLIFKAFLQGILKFKENIIITNIEMVGRLVFALVFIYFGLQVFGAIAGLLLSGIVGAYIGKRYLKEYNYTGFKDSHLNTKSVLNYSIPILVSSLAINSIMSADVILAKHFFDAKDAGIYASIATIGRIIFFATAPIATVMFPMISKRHASGEKYIKIFLLSLLMTAGMGGGVLLLFLFVPQLVVKSLYGNNFIAATQNIFYYGIFMLLFSLANVILNYYLSIGKTKLAGFALLAAASQIAGIYFFHQNIISIIYVSIITCLSLFAILLLYFFKETR